MDRVRAAAGLPAHPRWSFHPPQHIHLPSHLIISLSHPSPSTYTILSLPKPTSHLTHFPTLSTPFLQSYPLSTHNFYIHIQPKSPSPGYGHILMTVIISDYSGFYEKIHTEETKFMLLLKFKYFFKGYRVWAFPTIWMSKLIHKWFGKSVYKGTNVSFEKYIPGTDQVTFWQPWMNFR